MHLPPELHDEILRHLDARPDVAAYRLVCRRFAASGAARLFERLRFCTALDSLRRLACVGKSACGGYVRHLMWNTTGSECEARALLEGLGGQEWAYVLGEGGPGLAGKQYQELDGGTGSKHGSASRGVLLLRAIFARFPRLKGVYVVTSSAQPNAFADDGWALRSSHCLAPEDTWPRDWPATHGCPRCHGLCPAIQSNGRYETQAAALAAHLAGRPLTALRVSTLAFWAARTEGTLFGYEAALGRLTHLDVVLRAPNRALAEVQAFFRAAPRLRVLKLWLHSSSWWESVDHAHSVLRLQDMLPRPDAFPALRELELHQMDVSAGFLAAFLLAHAATLRVLRMHRMRLDPQGSWPALFAGVRGRLGLDAVWLHGHFEEGVGDGGGGWDMDAPHGRRLEAHLLGGDDECPIGEGNRWCRW